MPRPTIDYMNARRASKPASGGSFKDWGGKTSPDHDVTDEANAIIAEFSRWAECSRQRYLAAWGVEEQPDTEMVF